MVVNEEQGLEFYKLITENANDLIRVLNDRLEIEYINEKSHLEILGYDKEDLIGKMEGIPIDPKDYPEARRFLYKIFKVGQAKRTGKIQCKNGNWIWVEIKGKAFKDKYGNQKAIMVSRDITERIKMEQNLRKESERAEMYLNLAGVILVAINREGIITLMNKKGYDVLEYEDGELIGKNWFEMCLPPDLREQVYGVFKQLVRGELEPVEYFENPIITKNGEEKIIAWHNAILYDDEGKIAGSLSSGEDITARKKTEHKLKKSEEKYRLLFELIPTGIGIADFNGKIIAMNEKMHEMTGFTLEELKKINLSSTYVDPNERKKLLKILEESGTVPNYDVKLKKKDGTTYFASLKIDMIEIDGEKYILTNQEDITEHKKAEEKLKQSEERFKYLISSSPAILYTSKVTDDYGTTFISKNVKDQMGYIPQNFTEDSEFWLNHIHPDERKRVLSGLSKLFNKGYHTHDYRFLYKDGSYHWMRDELILIKDENGIPIETIGSIIDITESKKAQKVIEDQNKFLTNLIESLTHPFYVINVDDYTIALANSAASFGEIDKNSTCYALTHNQSVPCGEIYQCPLEEMKKIKKPVMVEHIHYNENGIPRYFEVHGYPIFDNDGNIIQMIEYALDITERKEAEQKLKDSEEKYRLITENSNDLIRVLNEDFEIEYINEAAHLKILGYKKEDLMGKFSAYINHPEDFRQIRQIMLKIYKIGEYFYETRIKHKKGSFLWFEVKAKSFKDEANNQKYLLISRDITERKIAEKALNESKQLFERVVHSLHDALFILDADNPPLILDCNPAVEDIFGYYRQDILGLPTTFLHINNTTLREFQNILYPKIEEDGFLLDYEFKMKRKDGSVFPSEHSIIPITDENNKRIGWVSVVRDITDRKEAQTKLKESEKRYRHLFEQSPNEIILLDSNGKIIDVNIPFLDYFGYKKEELLEFDFRSIEKFPSGDITLYKKIFEKVLINGIFEPIEFQAYNKNNDEKWMEIRASAIELDDIKLIQIILQDIDKRKKTEEALKSERDKLQAIIDGLTSAGLGIDIIGDDYKIQYMNKILKERFGDNIGKLCYESHMKSKEPCEDCPVIKTIKSNTVEHVEQTAVDKRDYEIFSAPIHNPNGTVDKSIELIIDITDRKRAELALKKSEEKYRNIVEDQTEFIVRFLPPDGILTFVNESYCRYFQKSQEQLIGKSFIPLIVEEDRDMIKKEITSLTPENPTESHEEKVILPNRHVAWQQWTNRAIFNEEGKVIEIQSIGRDISERKKAELKLKESEENFRTITEQSLMGICIAQDNKIKYINQKYADIWGYSVEEMMKWNLKDVANAIHPDDRTFILEQLAKKQRGVQNIDTQYQYRGFKKSGEIIWVDNYSKSIKYQDKPADLVTVIDISEKKDAEQKLRESEEKFRTIAEQSLIGIGIIQDNLVKYLNEQFAEMLGYTTDEILNWTPKEFLKSAHPDDREFISEQARRKQEGLYDYLPQYEFQAIKKSGEIIWIDNYTRSIHYGGKPADLVAFIDITEKKKFEEELIKLNKLKSELLTRSSHELKTPLMSIKGFTDLMMLKYNEVLNDEELFLINEIRKGCNRLEILINDILKTADLESGSIIIQKSENDLSNLIKNCVNDLKGFADSRNHLINLMIHDKLITSIEIQQIRQAINNILSNAIKYTPPNGKIDIKSQIDNNFIIISIQDTGIGFTTEEKEQLFKQFGKIERFGQGFNVITEGSGLGLYISKKIVELHGGDVWVESEGRNKGSIFYISLPISSS